jgi:hypothetical protein
MKQIFWIKKEVWCKYPFQNEIAYMYIEFHTKVRHNHKTKLDFTCDSSVIGNDRFDFVAEKLGTENFKLVSIATHNKNKYKLLKQ